MEFKTIAVGNKMKELEKIFNQLGLNKDNGLFITKENLWKKEIAFPNRTKRLIEQKKIKPDAFFCFDNKPLILFFSNPEDKHALHQIIWNFNESPIAIIVENDSVEIFNGFKYVTDNKLLDKIGGSEKLNDFSYFELVTGRTWEQYHNQLEYKNRVDYKLLDNIKTARELLLGQNALKDHAKIINALIGKTIFVRYLIDRKVKIRFDGIPKTWSNSEFCSLLDDPKQVKRFFDYLESNETGFNGDLFPLTSGDYKNILPSDYSIIKRLLMGEELSSGQFSLFQYYDFSIIPIEFISNVYEYFIGQENQKSTGAYYTPLFLVDYILKETVEKKLNSTRTEYNCKVLDPACGSGIFLVETLRKIIEKYILIANIKSKKSDKFKTALKKITKENIYGIDKDPSAVQVAIFSVYLTLLDYLEPPEIETFKFPSLLNTNFFEADFFDGSSQFNNNFKNIEFDFLVGNPPWMRGKGEKEKPLYVSYIDKRRRKEQGIPAIDIGNKEIAQAFLLRASDFSKEKTKCALIVTSKALYNLQSVKFRKYFLKHFFIERAFELAPVRREVFDKSNDEATSPACILFFHYANGANTDSNTIEHITLKPSRFFSLFKIFTICRTDFKLVQQNKLKEFDWLWKVLVYGSCLDFNLLKRLKNDYSSISKYFKENDVLVKQGIKRKDGKRKINVSELVGWDFLDLNKKELKQYSIVSKHEKWSLNEVGYIYRENKKICQDIFSPLALLVKETVNTRLESVAAISSKKIVFTDKVTSIKIRQSENVDNYYLLAGLMNSTLFAYYTLTTSSTAGIMIEQQIHDCERFSFPYIYSNKIINLVKKISSYAIINNTTINDQQNHIIEHLKENVNKEVENSFELSNKEKALIDYAKSITIPLSMKHPDHETLLNSLMFKHQFINDYANLFIERFSQKNNKKKFIVEIWYTKQIIGMFFKFVPIAKYSKDIIWKNMQNDESGMISLIAGLSSEKITDRLFVQKDIRGFEEDYFYIFKPNEKRLWHKAIAYLDVDEFANAILREGMKGK